MALGHQQLRWGQGISIKAPAGCVTKIPRSGASELGTEKPSQAGRWVVTSLALPQTGPPILPASTCGRRHKAPIPAADLLPRQLQLLTLQCKGGPTALKAWGEGAKKGSQGREGHLRPRHRPDPSGRLLPSTPVQVPGSPQPPPGRTENPCSTTLPPGQDLGSDPHPVG